MVQDVPMKYITTLALAGIFALSIPHTSSAQQTSGNLGFTGEILVNSPEASTATEALGWNSTYALGGSGSFAGLGGQPATFTAPWFFDNTNPIANFWTVDGFSFTLLNSAIDPTGTGGGYPFGSIKVDLSGTVSGDDYATTPFAGTMTFADPNDGSGLDSFTVQLSFTSLPVTTPVPEPGSAVLLGLALPALALLKRKFKG